MFLTVVYIVIIAENDIGAGNIAMNVYGCSG
jgi:hypothetical protein